jgi:hypothetical protein
MPQDTQYHFTAHPRQMSMPATDNSASGPNRTQIAIWIALLLVTIFVSLED